ncbi:hypothetical protein C1645_820662 [Glomus cerebriforme]|uniref:Uncharacterized protein n=1 Tax=Glomus cerebriforme TaxID=658196 RepID=A0A397TC93_9GLOM|nr:hypothetical protein C1645_820662 [Glomus cerebriforme]
MSALVLQNNALWYIFEDFTASILLSTCFLIYVIRNQFSNHFPTHDNKVANELSARMFEINGILTAEIENNKTRDGSITAKIERLLTDVYKKLSTEVNTKIANELFTRLFEVNSTFTVELVKNNNELNKKLTGEIAKINSRDAGYASEVQKIFSIVNNITTKVNNIEEACRNDFCRINVVIKNLQNEINQHYAIVQRSNFDQQSVSNESEANSTNESETNSSPSSSSSGIIDIRSLGGNIKTSTVKNFYNGVSSSKVSTINQINAWVASFNNNAE